MALTLTACKDDEVVDSGQPADARIVEGDEITCDAPVDGFVRLEEQGEQRGLQPIEPYAEMGGCNYVPSAMVAQDMDGDGDPDLLVNDRSGFPVVYENDGGQFSVVSVDLPVESIYGREVLAFAAVDLDGDSLPELTVVGEDLVLTSHNEGGLRFSDWTVVLDDPSYPRTCISSLSFGDVDGDGDLDLALPGLDEVHYEGQIAPGSGEWYPTSDRLYLNEEGTFRNRGEYSPEPGFSITVAFSDRDNDGDLDLLAGTDRPFMQYPPMAVLRNDGTVDGKPVLVNEAAELEADVRVSAMGFSVHDMNGDGLYDYCMSDVSFDFTCLMSVPGGPYYEAGAAMGLTVDLTTHPEVPDDYEERMRAGDFAHTIWVSWGFTIMDLDNDGLLDVAATAGPPPDYGSPYTSDIHGFQPDWIWQGVEPARFESRTVETGFGNPAWNYSLVTADFDGDGYRDMVLGPSEGRPSFWSNPCGSKSWLEVDLVGAADNAEGYGARVEVTAGGATQIQEMHNLLAVGQSVSALHFGLGDAKKAQLKVVFPSGKVVEGEVGVNRHVTVRERL